MLLQVVERHPCTLKGYKIVLKLMRCSAHNSSAAMNSRWESLRQRAILNTLFIYLIVFFLLFYVTPLLSSPLVILLQNLLVPVLI